MALNSMKIVHWYKYQMAALFQYFLWKTTLSRYYLAIELPESIFDDKDASAVIHRVMGDFKDLLVDISNIITTLKPVL